ncbi:MAG TPA: site-specific integrase [Polyangia bacterium]|nr:site-specific integrase [Polyangia bacterium]
MQPDDQQQAAQPEQVKPKAKTRRQRKGRSPFGSIKVDGPRFAATWWEGPVQRKRRGFESRGAAELFLAQVRIDLQTGERQIGDPVVVDGVTVEHAIQAYGRYLDEKGLKPGPNAERLRRLRAFFSDTTVMVSALTPAVCAAYYAALRMRTTKTGKPYSVDSQRNTLAEAKMLAKWCVSKRWLRTSPLDGIEGMGKRRHGKAQLRIDEARRWMAEATKLADVGDQGAVAAMMPLLLGMRASEIVTRVVRDLDDDGRLLWIPDAKTEAGKRTLRIPEVLQPYLERLATHRKPEDLIFGQHWRDWIRKSVKRVCELAGVPVVCAHSMRGLHSTLAMDAGVTGHVVAASLGHESVTTTKQSYAKPEAVAGGQQRRTLAVLAGGLA